LANHADSSSELLDFLAQQADCQVLEQIIKHPNCPMRLRAMDGLAE
jgi:hypothetical protein